MDFYESRKQNKIWNSKFTDCEYGNMNLELN